MQRLLVAVVVACILATCSKTQETGSSTAAAPAPSSANTAKKTTPPPAGAQRVASGGTATQACPQPVATSKGNDGKKPLVVTLSNTRSWVAWELAMNKRWLAPDAVAFKWLPYVASMEAFGAGAADAIALTNADLLNVAHTGTPVRAIVAFARGTTGDALIAKPSIRRVEQLKGKRVGAELGFLGHLLLRAALEHHGLMASELEVLNVPADVAHRALLNGSVDAVFGGPKDKRTLNDSGASVIFTSKDLPGATYDVLAVSPKSLSERPQEWRKVVQVWFRIAKYLDNPANTTEAAAIIGARMGVELSAATEFLSETLFLGRDGNRACFAPGNSLASIRQSSRLADRFHVQSQVYARSLPVDRYFDARWMNKVADN